MSKLWYIFLHLYMIYDWICQILGQALGGIFAAVANILSIFLAADQLTSAFLYFLLGSFSLFISLLLSIFLPKIIFYKFYLGEKGGPFRWVENYPPGIFLQSRLVFLASCIQMYNAHLAWCSICMYMLFFGL